MKDPTTIEELKEWYRANNLPPAEVTRFFIGEDYIGDRAFGIYYKEDTGDYVVYKNKDNGQRSIRYIGPDEEYAVKELLNKLKDEIRIRKGSPTLSEERAASLPPEKEPASPLVAAAVIVAAVLVFVLLAKGFIHYYNSLPDRGYYQVDDDLYYRISDDEWYVWDALDDEWQYADTPIDATSWSSYYLTNDYSTLQTDYPSGSTVSDFTSTDYYNYYVPDDDYDYSWDSDSSWDSSDTDWSSDW